MNSALKITENTLKWERTFLNFFVVFYRSINTGSWCFFEKGFIKRIKVARNRLRSLKLDLPYWRSPRVMNFSFRGYIPRGLEMGPWWHRRAVPIFQPFFFRTFFWKYNADFGPNILFWQQWYDRISEWCFFLRINSLRFPFLPWDSSTFAEYLSTFSKHFAEHFAVRVDVFPIGGNRKFISVLLLGMVHPLNHGKRLAQNEKRPEPRYSRCKA